MKYQAPSAAQGAFRASGPAGCVHWWPLVEPAMDMLNLLYNNHTLAFMELTLSKFNMEPENDGFQFSLHLFFQMRIFRWTMLNIKGM